MYNPRLPFSRKTWFREGTIISGSRDVMLDTPLQSVHRASIVSSVRRDRKRVLPQGI